MLKQVARCAHVTLQLMKIHRSELACLFSDAKYFHHFLFNSTLELSVLIKDIPGDIINLCSENVSSANIVGLGISYEFGISYEL